MFLVEVSKRTKFRCGSEYKTIIDILISILFLVGTLPLSICIMFVIELDSTGRSII